LLALVGTRLIAHRLIKNFSDNTVGSIRAMTICHILRQGRRAGGLCLRKIKKNGKTSPDDASSLFKLAIRRKIWTFAGTSGAFQPKKALLACLPDDGSNS
jgi:hypothetical protein